MQFADLSPSWQRLLRLFQSINFGRVEELEIRSGEPVFSPEPRVFLELKLDAADGPRPERRLDRFGLCSQVERFVEQVGRLNDGTVERIEVRHGLPFRMVIEATPAEVES
jgi:hypothetical protein